MPTPRHIRSAQSLKAPRVIWECGGLPPLFATQGASQLKKTGQPLPECAPRVALTAREASFAPERREQAPALPENAG